MKPTIIFNNFDVSNFWENCDYARKEYVEEYPTNEIILDVEEKLGYKLPKAYIELMKIQNGGIPNNCFFPIKGCNAGVYINGIMGIGNTKNYSLCGNFGSQFMMDEWEYPTIGIYICDCPSGGHDMIALDYSTCGKMDEPTVVHIDQENDYEKTFLAKDFETFIRGLENEN